MNLDNIGAALIVSTPVYIALFNQHQAHVRDKKLAQAQERNTVATEAAKVAAEAAHEEIKTINSQSAGEQIDAATIARIEAIPFPERTEEEQSHLDAAGPKEPGQGPPQDRR